MQALHKLFAASRTSRWCSTSPRPVRTPLALVRASRRRSFACASKNSSSNNEQSEEPAPSKSAAAKAEEPTSDESLRRKADNELGPLLESMGIEAEPSAFLDEVMTLAVALQLGSCGMMFWALQLYGDWSTAAAMRATVGLAAGLLTRPLLETELLFLPLYNDLMEIVFPVSMMEATASKEDVARVLNTVGALLFVGFLVPQMVFHLTSGEATQLVVPMAAGWLVFDLAYLLAFLVKLRII